MEKGPAALPMRPPAPDPNTHHHPVLYKLLKMGNQSPRVCHYQPGAKKSFIKKGKPVDHNYCTLRRHNNHHAPPNSLKLYGNLHTAVYNQELAKSAGIDTSQEESGRHITFLQLPSTLILKYRYANKIHDSHSDSTCHIH